MHLQIKSHGDLKYAKILEKYHPIIAITLDELSSFSSSCQKVTKLGYDNEKIELSFCDFFIKKVNDFDNLIQNWKP